MNVPEALEELRALAEMRQPVPPATRQRQVTLILEAVWLQAYEEGESRVFGGAPRLIDEHGRDLGEIIETDSEDSGDPSTGRYVVYVKKGKG